MVKYSKTLRYLQPQTEILRKLAIWIFHI